MEHPPEITIPIAETVSEALERPIEDLPPLSDSISLDGVEAIVAAASSGDVRISFTYAGLYVVVDSGQTVYVEPIHNGFE
jgi:hypothetical protein